MPDKVTSDTIITALKGYVESKTPIAPMLWLDGAMKLAALMSDETDRLADLEHEVALKKVAYFLAQEKRSVAEATMLTEASDEHLAFRKQQGRLDQINEMIMLAKKYATAASQEFGRGSM